MRYFIIILLASAVLGALIRCSSHSEVRVIECPKGTMVAEDGTMKFKSYDSIVKEWQELKFEQSKWIFWRDNHKY